MVDAIWSEMQRESTTTSSSLSSLSFVKSQAPKKKQPKQDAWMTDLISSHPAVRVEEPVEKENEDCYDFSRPSEVLDRVSRDSEVLADQTQSTATVVRTLSRLFASFRRFPLPQDVVDELSEVLLRPVLRLAAGDCPSDSGRLVAAQIVGNFLREISDSQFLCALDLVVPMLASRREISEEVRTVWAREVARVVVERVRNFPKSVGASYVDNLVLSALSVVREESQELVLAGLEQIEQLMSSELGEMMVNYTLVLGKQVAQYTLLHKHKIVRIKAIDTLTSIARKCAWKNSFEFFSFLAAWQDPNLVPIAAFFDDDISISSPEVNKVNYCSVLTFDSSSQVRHHWFHAMLTWLIEFPDKVDFEHLLLPFVLTALFDSDALIRTSVYDRLATAFNARLLQEFAADLKDVIQSKVDAPWTQYFFPSNPFPALDGLTATDGLAGSDGLTAEAGLSTEVEKSLNRPPIGLRQWVRRHARKFVRALFEKISDFMNVRKSHAVNLLVTVIWLVEDQASEWLSEILRIPDNRLVSQVARYVPARIWLDVSRGDADIAAQLVRATMGNLKQEVSDLGPLEEVKTELEQMIMEKKFPIIKIYVENEKLRKSVREFSKFLGIVVETETRGIFGNFSKEEIEKAVPEILGGKISRFTVEVLRKFEVELEIGNFVEKISDFSVLVEMWKLTKSEIVGNKISDHLKKCEDVREMLKNLKQVQDAEISDHKFLRVVLTIAVDGDLEKKLKSQMEESEILSSKSKRLREEAEEISDQVRVTAACIYLGGVVRKLSEMAEEEISDLVRHTLKLWGNFRSPHPVLQTTMAVVINTLTTKIPIQFPIPLKAEAPGLTALARPRRSQGKLEKPMKTLATLLEALVALNLPLPVEVGHPNAVIANSDLFIGRAMELPKLTPDLEEGLKWNAAWRLVQTILDVGAMHPAELASLGLRWDEDGLMHRVAVVNWLLNKITI